MAKITWDTDGSKWIRTGVNKVNLRKFDAGTPGVGGTCAAWSGVTAVSVTPSGAEVTKLYADNILYMEMMSVEEVGASIEAYAYPEAFEECNGIKSFPIVIGYDEDDHAIIKNAVKVKGQPRRRFSLAWVGLERNDNDVEHEILHILYNCQASPSEVQNQTISDSPEALTYSWELTCTPLPEFTLDNVNYKNVYKLDIDLSEYKTAMGDTKYAQLMALFEDDNADGDLGGWTPAALRTATLI